MIVSAEHPDTVTVELGVDTGRKPDECTADEVFTYVDLVGKLQKQASK